MDTRLRELREARKLSRNRLARALEVDPSTVLYWENTGRIPDDRKLALAEMFGVSRSYLMRWDEEKVA